MATDTSKLFTGGPTSVIVINTENVEGYAAKISDVCQNLRSAHAPIPTARENLTALNKEGRLTKGLQHLYDAEVSFYKHAGQLDTAAVMLRNIAVNYDNAEQLLLGGDTRDMIKPAKAPEIGPYAPCPDAPEEEKEEKKEEKNDEPKWKWDKREGVKNWEDVDSWYEYLFDSKHKLNIGQKKKYNSPPDGKGTFENQRQFAWNLGLNVGKGKYDLGKPLNDKLKDSGWLKETKTKGDDKFAPKKAATLFEVSAGYSCSWTGLGAQYYNMTDYSLVFAEAYVGRAQFNAQAGAGAFLYKTPDGRLVNAYGVAASVGASFTVAGANTALDYGNEWLGVGINGDVKVGNVYAKADAIVGMVDGKFNAVVSGAVGAEAVSASISPTVRLAGIEASLTAGVTVGVGAKFEVGFQDGKFKANIGASLGIGFDISINIDFSKCLSVVKDVVKGVVAVGKAVGNAIVSAGRAIANFFRRW